MVKAQVARQAIPRFGLGAVRHGVLPLLALALAVPASAQGFRTGADRDLCADRPGLNSPACTVAPGRVQIEASLIDWTRDRRAGERIETWLLGDSLLRVGIGGHSEVRIGWTPVGRERVRDAAGGRGVTRVGDVTLSVRRNLRHPDGEGLAIAVQPTVSLPVGRTPIGAGDWGAGLIVPVTFDLSSRLHADLTPGMDAAVDEDGRGRHLAYGGIAGLTLDVGKAVSLTGEVALLRDRDPAGHATEARAALSAAWATGRDSQLDIGAVVGLNRVTPDLQLIAGVTRRF